MAFFHLHIYISQTIIGREAAGRRLLAGQACSDRFQRTLAAATAAVIERKEFLHKWISEIIRIAQNYKQGNFVHTWHIGWDRFGDAFRS
jgi:hypothetical protein